MNSPKFSPNMEVIVKDIEASTTVINHLHFHPSKAQYLYYTPIGLYYENDLELPEIYNSDLSKSLREEND